jgi:molybdate transport system ATP-binding protein
MLAVLRLRQSQSADRLLARVTRRSWEQLGLAQGMDVYAQIKSVALAPG